MYVRVSLPLTFDMIINTIMVSLILTLNWIYRSYGERGILRNVPKRQHMNTLLKVFPKFDEKTKFCVGDTSQITKGCRVVLQNVQIGRAYLFKYQK